MRSNCHAVPNRGEVGLAGAMECGAKVAAALIVPQMAGPIGTYETGAKSAVPHPRVSRVCPEAMARTTQSTKIPDVVAAAPAANDVVDMAAAHSHAAVAVNATTPIPEPYV